MDVIFGVEEKDELLEKYWNYLCDQSDRFSKSYTIIGKGEIDGFREEDAIEKLEYLASSDNSYSDDDKYIGYWDIYEEKIWVLSPVGMALLLQQYDVAERLLDKGRFEIELNTKIGCVFKAKDFDADEYTVNLIEYPPEYDERFPDSAKGIKSWYQNKYINTLDIIFADKNIPDGLIRKLMDRNYMRGVYDFDFRLLQNEVSDGEIDAKWLIKIYEISGNKKYFKDLVSYAFSQITLVDSVLAYAQSRNSYDTNMRYCHIRLQLQLDLARKMIESRDYKNLSKAVLNDCVLNNQKDQYGRFYASCPDKDKYFLERLKCLIKQRKLLLEICSCKRSLLNKVCINVLSEIVTARIHILHQDNLTNGYIELEDSYKRAAEAAIENYEELLRPYIKRDWSEIEIQSSMMFVLERLNSMVGICLVGAFSRCINKRLNFTTNDKSIKILNKWFTYIRWWPEITDSSRKYIYVSRLKKELNKINWKITEQWLGKKNNAELDTFIEKLSDIEDETLIETMVRSGLCKGDIANSVIDRLFANGKLQKIPFLIAAKDIK